MTRIWFMVSLRATVVGVGLTCGMGDASAAPIPKGANEKPPDLKAFLADVAKVIEIGKWPSEVVEKKLRDTPREIFNRVLVAAKQKERPLPVDFEKLKKLDVAVKFTGRDLNDSFVIAKDVRLTTAKKSVIIASGDVQVTRADDCVIISRNVICTGAFNCLLVADEFIRVTSADRLDGSLPSVLVAGQWILTTGMEATIAHVIRPTSEPSPFDKQYKLPGPYRAARTTRADGVVFLNEMGDTSANGPKNCTYLPQKTPIAK